LLGACGRECGLMWNSSRNTSLTDLRVLDTLASLGRRP
jgi:hypothetical protein